MTTRRKVKTHGYGGYTNGCRCGVCRDAKSAYMAKRRGQAFLNTGPVPDGLKHGARSTYEEHGCRCDECVAAVRASSRYATRSKAGAA